MQASSLVEARDFRAKVAKAVEKAHTVLDVARRPKLPEEINHKFDDKYALAGSLVQVSLGAWVNIMEALGVNAKSLRELKEWASDQNVTLRFKATESCTFDRETKRDVEADTKYVREGFGAKITDKVVTTVTEYFWKFECEYELFAFAGSDADVDKVVLQGRTCIYEAMTTSKETPRPGMVIRDPIDVNITFALHQIDKNNQFSFAIDRTADSCKTPRRNANVERAISFFEQFESFAVNVGRHYFSRNIFQFQTDHGLDLKAINDDTVFVPAIPLFIEDRGDEADGERKAQALVAVQLSQGSDLLLSLNDINRFLDEQKRSLSEKLSDLSKVFPEPGKLIGAAEANLLVLLLHAERTTHFLVAGLDYIEEMLRAQVFAAIGKEVGPVEFARYMLYHNQRIFREEYRPQAFAYPIRRPGHSPEGVLSLEASMNDGSVAQPVQTIVSKSILESPLQFGIGAGARVRFTGEMHLHGMMAHQFQDNTGLHVSLNARARQFSSFLILVGKMTGPGEFDPQYGMVVQNKDDVTIPLDLETIPSAGEFKAATVSISPEQQAFSKMYRGMQLSSTLFGVCAIQIKPQLEKVLNLSEDSLIKEIELTQDLMKLFIEYQIPSDLLSFGGGTEATKEERLESVKRNVKSVQLTLQLAKNKELLDALDESEKREMDSISTRADTSTVSASFGRMISPRGKMKDSARPMAKNSKRGGKVRNASMALKAGGMAPQMEMVQAESAPEAPMDGLSFSNDETPPPPPPSAPMPGPSESSMPPPPPPSAAGGPPPPPPAEIMEESSKSLAPASSKKKKKKMMSPRLQSKVMPASPASPASQSSSFSSSMAAPRRAAAPLKKKIDPAEQIRRQFTKKREDLVAIRKNLMEEREELNNSSLGVGDSSPLSPEAEDQGEQPFVGRDVTQIPAIMDAQLEKLDGDGALRPVIINVGQRWEKRHKSGLLAPMETAVLGVAEQKLERNTCYDLLDALTKSGSSGYQIEGASMHVIIASTHCFEKSVMNTLVQDNVNPIAKVEHSQLIVASQIFGKSVDELLEPGATVERIQGQSPALFLEGN